MARIIGLDVHRTFAEVAVHEHGHMRHAGRILTTTTALELFARGLTRRDHVILDGWRQIPVVLRHGRRPAA